MTLSLYQQQSHGEYENIFSWNPSAPQWWITGFSGHTSLKDYFVSADPKRMAVIASVDLEGTGLFNTKEKLMNDQAKNTDGVEKFIICEEENDRIWIIWYPTEV